MKYLDSFISVRLATKKDVIGISETLSHLSMVKYESTNKLESFFNQREEAGVVTIVAVDTSNNEIVGVASVFYEPKMSHYGFCVGHIEDVVVDPKYRGRHIGGRLIEFIRYASKRIDCYKLSLNCKSSNIGFYQRFGFKVHEQQMISKL